MSLRDSTNPFDIPLDGLTAVAGYGDGSFTWTPAGWARFQPPIVPLSIVVSAANRGDVLDVENGDATPADCPGWADHFDRPGRRAPTIYCNRSTIDFVRQAMGPRRFDWWAATLDGTTAGTDGAVAVQWKGEAQTGGHYDESIILDPSWIGQTGGAVATNFTPEDRQALDNTEGAEARFEQEADQPGQDIGRILAEVEAVKALLQAGGSGPAPAGGVSPQQLANAVRAAAQTFAQVLTQPPTV
jgi:hypothetical protein